MVSSSQIAVADAAMALVRLLSGVRFTESRLTQPLAFRLTKYMVGRDGKTIGVAVLPAIIFAAGCQLKLPVPVAVSNTESNAQ